jgi:hypothetical protein
VPWLTLLLLGAFHGVNPAMGWLFATNNGLRKGSVRGVIRALPPIGLGHVLSVGAVAGVLVLTGRALPTRVATLAVGGSLIAFGLWHLLGRRKRRPVSGPVGWVGLATWSFLVATAHGAGLMLAPVLLPHSISGRGKSAYVYFCHVSVGTLRPTLSSALGATAVHSGCTLVVLSVIALAVYRAARLDVAQRLWMNLDRVWAVALVGAGMLIAL